MKAKNIKQHLPKENQQYMEAEDNWGNRIWTIHGQVYFTEQEAKQAVNDYITNEFNLRYKEKK